MRAQSGVRQFIMERSAYSASAKSRDTGARTRGSSSRKVRANGPKSPCDVSCPSSRFQQCQEDLKGKEEEGDD